MEHKLTIAILAILGSLACSSSAVRAAPLDGTWIPEVPFDIKHVVIHSSGVTAEGEPRYFVRVSFDCGAAAPCSTPQVESRSLPRTPGVTPPGADPLYFAYPFYTPAPPAFTFYAHTTCPLGFFGGWSSPPPTPVIRTLMCFRKEPRQLLPRDAYKPKPVGPVPPIRH